MSDRSRQFELIGGQEKREIRIVDADPEWPRLYQSHAATLHRALGPVAVQIEHIGSTSVPGLGAKPIIDILLVVPDSGDESSYFDAVQQAGYQLRVREPGFHEHRMFRTAARDVHIHVFSTGCVEIERYLLFRDRLRTNQIDRSLYEEEKRNLACREWDCMNDYADAKSEIVERIIAAARAERSQP